MAVPPRASELASALQRDCGSALIALGLTERLRGLQGSQEVASLVIAGPPGQAPGIWGARFSQALNFAAQHTPEFLAFANVGGYWHMLELLSDAKTLPIPQRQAFYAQFDDPQLFTLLLGTLASRGPFEQHVRGVIRNMARSPDLRKHVIPGVPTLVQNLSEAGIAQASAAALCNVACHSDAKETTIEAGAVRHLAVALRNDGLSADMAEDFIACMGVLTGGCESGLAALFEVAAVEGELVTFSPIISLMGRDSPGLRCMVVDVLGGFCAASPQFKTWLVTKSACISDELPRMLKADDAQVRLSALEFACLMVDVEAFASTFSNAGGVGAVGAILESEPEAAGVGAMGSSRPAGERTRQAPRQRDLAQFLMSKILMI